MTAFEHFNGRAPMAFRITLVLSLLPALAVPALAGQPPAPRSAEAPAIVVPLVFPVAAPVRWDDTWGAPRDGGARSHEGQDLPAPKMTRLVAVFDGTVTLGRPRSAGGQYTLKLLGDCGWTACYYHLNNDTPGTDDGKGTDATAFAPGLKTGDRVKAGQFVAFVGDSGNAEGSGSHLHFELRGPDGAINAAPSLRAALPPPADGVLQATPALPGVSVMATAPIDPPLPAGAPPAAAPAPSVPSVPAVAPVATPPPTRAGFVLTSRSGDAGRADVPGMSPAEAAEAQRLVDAVNAARRKAGISELTHDGRLRACALRRARHVAANGLRGPAGDTLSQRLMATEYSVLWSTELVGLGFSSGMDAADRWVLREGGGRLARNGRHIGVAYVSERRVWVVVLADPAA